MYKFKRFRVVLALILALTAAAGLAIPAGAFFWGESAPDTGPKSLEGRAYHGDISACTMTADEAAMLGAKLATLMTAYNENQYKDNFIRMAALVDMGSGVPALFYFEGLRSDVQLNPNGPGSNGSVDYFTENYSAWQIVNGSLVQFFPGWYHGDYMVYENLSGNGRSGGSYVVPIADTVNIVPDEYGYTWIDSSQSIAWYEWYLGSMGEDYADAYEDMYAGPNGEYEAVLKDPRAGCSVGMFENYFAGLEDAGEIWQALNAYAFEKRQESAANMEDLLPWYGEDAGGGMTPEQARAYARVLREEMPLNTDYGTRLYTFASLIETDDGAPMLWVIPAVMEEEWYGDAQAFDWNGTAFVGYDNTLWYWDGSAALTLDVVGYDRAVVWPEGVELRMVYGGSDVDGQNWEALYPFENGRLAAEPAWCHADGWLYEYALEDSGIYGGVPQDFELRKSDTKLFVDYKVQSGEWPNLPFDWNTFSTEYMLDDTLDFDVSGGAYQDFLTAHQVYNQEYNYYYIDYSQAGYYMDIQNLPGRWLLATELANLLDDYADELDSGTLFPGLPIGPSGGDETGDPADGAEDDNKTEDEDGTNDEERGENDRKRPASPEGGEAKDIPVGLLIGIGAGVLVAGGGAGAAIGLTAKKRRNKANSAPRQQENGYTGYAQQPIQPQAQRPVQQPAQPQAQRPVRQLVQPQVQQPAQQGRQQAKVCPNCGAACAPGAKFCTKCGTHLM